MADATIITEINPRNVTQTMIGDCSFVSAMILSAGFERKFKKKILTCSFFPQKDGKPVLNPHGKYCVRLGFASLTTKLPFYYRGGYKLRIVSVYKVQIVSLYKVFNSILKKRLPHFGSRMSALGCLKSYI